LAWRRVKKQSKREREVGSVLEEEEKYV
jgi:hypothetical protein